MPNPKRKISKSRRDKRRTHIKDYAKTIGTDTKTGEAHLMHRAHWFEGELYYKGRVVIEKVEK
jgi:large subunit ribosomal protein L32